ncbi:MAG: DUF2993 domain-containing protein [Cyanobacteriota bacterium]|nr:DUF2993 domain-containing protein [Cyanobacteriota bacterium]
MSSTQTSSKPIVGKVLSQAIKLWLRSQAEQIDQLEISILGHNRSILTGHIPQVTVQANSAVYRELHLSEIDLSASDIKINIGQVLKGKPLRLLKAFPVDCHVCLLSEDLNTSSHSTLLNSAIAQHLLPLIQSQVVENRNFSFPTNIKSLQDLKIVLAPNQLTLTAEICSTDDQLIAFSFQTELYLASPTELLLASGHLELLQQHYQLENMTLDLGTDVSLESLNISSEKLEMKGEIKVNP